MTTVRTATLHGYLLIGCSLIGIAGYYAQHGAFQLTACIPASVGLTLLLVAKVPMRRQRARTLLLLAITFAFGLVVTRLAWRFVFQDFQPLRKRLYFPAMALSSALACAVMARRLRRPASEHAS
jgi:hypothetical protein